MESRYPILGKYVKLEIFKYLPLSDILNSISLLNKETRSFLQEYFKRFTSNNSLELNLNDKYSGQSLGNFRLSLYYEVNIYLWKLKDMNFVQNLVENYQG